MSIIKLASIPVIVVNNQQDSSSRASAKNLVAAGVGGTTGFAANEAIERLPKFNNKKMLHRYGRRMGSVVGGFAGAAGVYHLLNKKQHKEQKPQFYKQG